MALIQTYVFSFSIWDLFQAKTVNHIEKRAYWGVFPKNTGFYWSADEPGLQQRQYGSIRKSNNLDPLLKVWLFWDESGMCVLLTDLHGELGTYVKICMLEGVI